MKGAVHKQVVARDETHQPKSKLRQRSTFSKDSTVRDDAAHLSPAAPKCAAESRTQCDQGPTPRTTLVGDWPAQMCRRMSTTNFPVTQSTTVPLLLCPQMCVEDASVTGTARGIKQDFVVEDSTWYREKSDHKNAPAIMTTHWESGLFHTASAFFGEQPNKPKSIPALNEEERLSLPFGVKECSRKVLCTSKWWMTRKI